MTKNTILTITFLIITLWTLLFLFEDTKIAIIYFVDTIYYSSISILAFIYYLKFLEYAKKIKKHPYRKFAKLYSFYMEYQPMKVVEYVLNNTRMITFTMLTIIITSGFYSYKLDYQYNTDNVIVNKTIIDKSNISETKTDEKIIYNNFNNKKAVEIVSNTYYIIIVVALFLFFVWLYFQAYRKSTPSINKIVFTGLISTFISATATITVSMIDFNIDKFSIFKDNDFTLYKEINNKNLISEKDNQNKYTLSQDINATSIYFDKGSIIVNRVDAKKDLDNILNNLLNKNNHYIIKLTGFASTETVQHKNTLTNNYQISLARANNVKKYILDILDKNNFNRENIFIDTFAYSNQGITIGKTNQHDINRKVIIEIIELKKINILSNKHNKIFLNSNVIHKGVNLLPRSTSPEVEYIQKLNLPKSLNIK